MDTMYTYFESYDERPGNIFLVIALRLSKNICPFLLAIGYGYSVP